MYKYVHKPEVWKHAPMSIVCEHGLPFKILQNINPKHCPPFPPNYSHEFLTFSVAKLVFYVSWAQFYTPKNVYLMSGWCQIVFRQWSIKAKKVLSQARKKVYKTRNNIKHIFIMIQRAIFMSHNKKKNSIFKLSYQLERGLGSPWGKWRGWGGGRNGFQTLKWGWQKRWDEMPTRHGRIPRWV